ncbi:FAD-dependent oxidoreductase [Candidatus Micrarchaeota archaeon]|nr:FAD-dependent oxidoreductase [Candidatus Micrarchaeota archaeon]
MSSRSIIIATGTEWRKLGVPGEEQFSGKGVHYCALCDGYAYKDKIIAVIGGADSAAKEAILLTRWAKKVYMIYRKETIRPEPITLANVEEKIREGKMEIINNANVLEIKGDQRLTHIILDRKYNGGDEFKLDGLFVEIGHNPQSGLAKQIGVELSKKGEINVNRNAETNLDGVYAAGDVTDGRFKQAIIASAEGVQAIYSAYEYLKSKK